MSELIYDDLIKGGKIFNRWEQAVKDAIDDNFNQISDKVSKSGDEMTGDLVMSDSFLLIARADGTIAGGIFPSDNDDFGIGFGGVDQDGVLTNQLLFASTNYIGPNNQFIANDNSLPHGYLKLGGAAVDDGNGNLFYPITFQQIEQEIYSEPFSDATDTILTGSYQTILTSTGLTNGYVDPASANWTVRIGESSGKATAIDFRFLVNGTPTGAVQTHTIAANTKQTILGDAQLVDSLSIGDIITMECRAIDTGGGRITTVLGTETATLIILRQLGFGALSRSAISISGGSSTTSLAIGELFIELTNTGTYTLPLLSTLEKYNFTISLFNNSGGAITVQCSGSDLINGSASQVMNNYDSMPLWVKSNEYLIK